jgi:nucleotide-binding universal stress UspA family protein
MPSMKVIAAITDDSAAAGVLASATGIATLFSASVEALHVGEENTAVAQAAQRAGVALTTVAGGVPEVISEAAAGEDVAAIVIGTRASSAGLPPAGTAVTLITSLEKPIVVVPPNAAVDHRIESVLVALDGTSASTAALQEIMELAATAAVKVVVAHVYDERSLPAFSDQLPHEVRAWREEFIARHCPPASAASLELRVGKPQEHLLDILRTGNCDLVALGWSQSLAGRHGAIVRHMLAESPVPVLLTPVSPGLVRGAVTTTSRL